MRELNGRVAVVTGAASGIGRALAGRFAAEGMRCLLADVEEEPLGRAVDDLRRAGGKRSGSSPTSRRRRRCRRSPTAPSRSSAPCTWSATTPGSGRWDGSPT